jgi:hypothetical protein
MPMPKTKKRSSQRRKTTHELAKELTAVKGEVEDLRARYKNLQRTLLRLCCPREWFEEKEIDDNDLLSKAVEVPSFDKWIERLSK